MGFYDYQPFDYWSTPSYDFFDENVNIKEYGLNESDVLTYKRVMEEDRRRWKEKQSSYNGWGFTLQLLAAVLIIVITILLKTSLNQLFEVYDEDSFANNILTFLFFGGMVFLEWKLWSKDLVCEWFYLWLANRYKIKSQNNVIIEKYLEECHWESYKRMKPLYDREKKRLEEKIRKNAEKK